MHPSVPPRYPWYPSGGRGRGKARLQPVVLGGLLVIFGCPSRLPQRRIWCPPGVHGRTFGLGPRGPFDGLRDSPEGVSVVLRGSWSHLRPWPLWSFWWPSSAPRDFPEGVSGVFRVLLAAPSALAAVGLLVAFGCPSGLPQMCIWCPPGVPSCASGLGPQGPPCGLCLVVGASWPSLRQLLRQIG